MEVTVKLLENAMSAAMQGERSGDGWSDGRGRFLIDGFPRKMDQALKFEEEVCGVLLTEFALTVIFRQVCISSLVVVFTTTEEVMVRRLLERGKTSGRDDDNEESIKKRFGISLFKPQSHRKLIFT
jgi:UMP-CMP kinase